MKTLSVIIVNYNSKELLARTLDSVKKYMPCDLHVETIVSDNGSTDGSCDMVRQCYPWVRLIQNFENLGFSRGNNVAVRASVGEYVLFLNSDTEISEGVISYIYAQMSAHDDIGVATCKVVLSDGTLDPASHRGFPTPWRAFTYFFGFEYFVSRFRFPSSFRSFLGGYHLLGCDFDIPHEIDACTGAFMMVRRSTGDAVGWWSEEYFMYGEDLDFCYKVKQLGQRIMYFPAYSILHLKHASGLKKDLALDHLSPVERDRILDIKRKTTCAFYDSMIIFYEKFYRDSYPFVLRFCIYFFIWVKKSIALLRIRF